MPKNSDHHYLGKWKHQNVYTYFDSINKHWVIYIRHSYFGDLVHMGLPRKPKLGKAKTLFKDRLRELNEQEKMKNDRLEAETYGLVAHLCGLSSGIREQGWGNGQFHSSRKESA